MNFSGLEKRKSVRAELTSVQLAGSP